MSSPLSLTELRCEYRRDPLGVETMRPRLSWVLASARRAERQTAYRVLVASRPELLDMGMGDCWDSGRVEGGDTCQIVYAGRALGPCSRAWWRVMAWDGNGEVTAWSTTACWEQALGDGWRAQWIGLAHGMEDERLPLTSCSWIRQAAAAPQGGLLMLHLNFTLPAIVIADAYLQFISDGYDDSWNHLRPYLAINGVPTELTVLGRMRAPARWQLARHLRAGINDMVIRVPRNDGEAFLGQLVVLLADGQAVRIPSGALWRARVVPEPVREPGARFPQGPEGWGSPDQDFSPAVEFGRFGAGPFPAEHIYQRLDRIIPPVVLRHDFTPAKHVASARLYATACGIYEVWLNGRRVGNQTLAPGWTDYRKRLQYQCEDVTALMRSGANAIAAVVADGWFSGYTSLGSNLYGTHKALLLQLHLVFADGSEQVVTSGDGWRASTGAVRSADIHMGQEVDWRRELRNWRDGDIDPAAWRPAAVLPVTVGVLQAQGDEPVRATAVIAPRSVTERRPGCFIIDFGQNLVGRMRIRLRLPAGVQVTLRHGEMLAKDGTLYTENLRTARATDTVIGDGVERWFEPTLTYHGFRYAEVTGIFGPLDAEDVTAVVINSDCPWSGGFSCSDPRLERLQSNIRWSQRGNFISIPTDCPQRDERAGWAGDAQIFIRTATANMDCAPFFTKYQLDMVDGQHANGAFPDFAPCAEPRVHSMFGWGDAGVMVPWTIWQVYGDTRIIENNLVPMMRWVENRTAGAKHWLNEGWSYGDWVSPPPQTPHEVLSPVYHFWAARLVAEMAEAIAASAEAARCREILPKVQSAWLAAHVGPDGRISSDTQAAYALALRSGIVPDVLREPMGRHLVAAVERAGWHLHTGFLGTGHLLPALSAVGRDDVAFRLLMTETYPSWLYPLTHGATTMWERWDGYHAELGPQNIGGMNSYNHYAFGAVGEWMYATIAGIDLAEPGGRRWLIRPRSGGVLTHGRGEYRSIRGTVDSAWHIGDGRFELSLTIPPGTTAEVHVPTRAGTALTEGGVPAAEAAGVRVVRVTSQEAVVEIASGRYLFAAPI